MKIDRRCFLSFVIGGALGTALTPVPWKLTDDIAIWTQNWPWTPVPEEGPSIYKKSVCTICSGGGCGINVRTIKGQAKKIEGQPDYPVNRGSICPLGISATQHLYGPSRIQSPLKRAGKRGEGRWEKISWDEAISTVSEKLSALRNQKKPHTVTCIAGSDRGTVAYLLERFLTAYGSPNFIRALSSFDAYELAFSLTQGQQGTLGYDLANSDFIVSFGAELMDGWGTAGQMFSLYPGNGKKSNLVQVEPRLSDTAAMANQWIAAKPGTESALALGIAHVIVRDNLYNKNFINNHCFGFEDWEDKNGKAHQGYRSLLRQYPPAKVAETTGIDKGTIESLARGFARAKRPVAIGGRGGHLASGGLDEALAVQALNALVGNINQPGGVVVVPEPDYLSWSEMKTDKTASEGLRQPRIDEAGTDKFPNTRFLLNRIPEAINRAKGESPIQALLVTGGNPLYTMPNTEAAKKAFDKIPFIASFSTYMDETAQHADILLPNHHFLERYEDVPTPAGTPTRVIGLTRPVVKPRFDTLHIGDVIIRIAGSLGGFIGQAFPWKNYQEFLKQTLSKQWETLEKQGYWVDSEFIPPRWARAFNTPSGKYEFYPQERNNPSGKDTDALPGFRPADLPGNPDKMPLTLLPYSSIRIAGGAVANPPFMTKTVDADVIRNNDIFVELNPGTAKKLGFSEGDAAILKTPAGEARVRIHLFEGLMPGLVAMPTGLGRNAFSSYIAGKGANVNALLADIAEPGSGLNKAWASRASLVKA
ncbi:MAG: molybdopterin-dependent oxidoreductase [Desulfobacteraceae bacterium]|nr:molybdopterin-dependent oxidoreductase [Desulfobacteraceae bacterium]